MRPDGLLLVTTPNRLTFSPGLEKPVNLREGLPDLFFWGLLCFQFLLLAVRPEDEEIESPSGLLAHNLSVPRHIGIGFQFHGRSWSIR